MYDELVKRLRRYSENVVAYKLDADFASAIQEAADAIEELSKQLDGMNEANIALYRTYKFPENDFVNRFVLPDWKQFENSPPNYCGAENIIPAEDGE